MSQEKKYFGMTTSQIVILVGLAIVACILFVAIGWLMLGKSAGLPFSRVANDIPTPQMTPTPFVIPTSTPTATPTQIPYEQLIPNGWSQFKTDLVEIWLPPSFKSTKKEADEELAALGTTSKSSLYKLRVSVSYAPLVGDSLDAFLDTEIAAIDPQARIVERRKVSLNSTEAVRMVLEGRINNVDVNELIYAIQDGGTVWFVLYAAQINEFYEMLPLFEQSAKTFRVVK